MDKEHEKPEEDIAVAEEPTEEATVIAVEESPGEEEPVSSADNKEVPVAPESQDAANVTETEEEQREPDLMDEVKNCAAHLERLEQLFRERIAHTDFEENSRARMHKELQEYRAGMYASLLKPLLLDVIEIREDILKTAAKYKEKEPTEQFVPLDVFSGYATMDMECLMEKYDVTDWQSQPGESFQPDRQKAWKKIPTEDADQHGKVAASLSRGYRYQGKVIRPERVSVYVYEAPKEQATPAT